MSETASMSVINRLALPALLLGAVGIAFAPIFVRLSELEPTATAFWRLALALPALGLWMRLEPKPVGGGRHRKPAGRRDFVLLALAGLYFAGDLAFWHWSIRFTSVANATLLANFAPIFVTLAGFLFFKERFSRTFLVGMGLAMAGALVLMSGSVSFGGDFLLGDSLGLITAVFYAAYIIAIGRLRANFSTATTMFWSGVATCAALYVVALASGEALMPPTPRAWAVLLGLALISHVGGQSLIAYALAHLPAAFSSVSLLLQPATAAVLAWVLLAEALGVAQATGGVVVLLGIYLARRGSKKKPA